MRRSINLDKQDGLTGALFAPTSDWRPPTSFPDLSGEKTIGLDIESQDKQLKERGPGFIRGDARVAGVSVSTFDRSWYFPISHLGGGNMDRDAVTRYVRDLLSRGDRSVIGANLQYELEGLDSEAIPIKCRLIDVQIAEALIDEEAETTSLEALTKKYLGGGKDETLLKSACDAHGLRDIKGSLWKLHSKYIGPYAEYDAMAPLKIFQQQLKILQAEELEPIFTLECKLLPILWLMRKRGITIDVDAAERLSLDLKVREDGMRSQMQTKYGTEIDEWSGPKLAMICDRLGIKYPRTEAGNPSFTADYIEGMIHPFLDDLSDLRELSKLKDTFVDGWILKNLVKGRIHPQWRQCASDEGGTRTGRMAAANPNPQQVPAGKYRKTGKPNDIGAQIRACFIPHEPGMRWMKCDYSEQEPRILVHFATLCKFTGAQEVATAYHKSRDFNVYQMMVDLTGLDKRPAKDCYLGRCYNMGKDKFARKLNKGVDEAMEILRKFDAGVPFVKEMAESCTSVAQRRGYIKTLLGRRRHFNLWEPRDAYKMRQAGDDVLSVTESVARSKWPGRELQRANCHKALNALVQGSAADQTKAAMVANFEQYGEYPYMQVHDELNHGVHTDEQANQLHHTIENCVNMVVPIISNMTLSTHWK